MSTEAESSAHPQLTSSLGAIRTQKADRRQMVMLSGPLDAALPADHPARLVVAVVQTLDLSRFYESIRTRNGVAGRDPIDPSILVSLWLLAAIDAVGSGRQLAELCEHHVAYRWVCGGVSMNYHTLNDFRTGHLPALNELFTQVLATLLQQKLISLQRITQDGTKVRASASIESFTTRDALQKHLAEARTHLEALGRLADESPSAAAARQRAAQDQVAAERVSRFQQAMQTLTEIENAKSKQKNKPSKHRPAKASTTDPDARNLKMPDGGFRPAYNIQLAQDPQSRAIVGVAIAADGNDKGQCEAMRQQVEARTGQKVQEHLYDGGYLTLEGLDRAAQLGVTIYTPVPKPRNPEQNRYVRRPDDSDAVAAWRERMNAQEGREIYQLRMQTCETVNADLKTHRGLDRLQVRGRAKVLSVVLWSALAYNLMHFGAAMLNGS